MTSLKFMRGALAPLALATTLAIVAACGKKDAAPDSRQVELTPAPSAQPALGDTAKTEAAPARATTPPAKAAPTRKPAAQPAPAAAAPAAAPAPAAPAPVTGKTGVIASGRTMNTALGTRVCTNTHKVGDRVTGTLREAVSGTNGASIPSGATVTYRVSQSQRGENGKEGIRLAFEPVAVSFGGSTYGITGTAVMTQMETIRAQSTGDQAKKVGAGAVIGAIAGELLGKKAKTAAVGAVVGAAAGGVVAAGTADWNACLGQGATLTVTLGAPVTVKAGAGSGL